MALTGFPFYTYRPLPDNVQTRIIELQPSSVSGDGPTSRLRCRLRDFNVYGDEEYEAISYTWGAPNFTETLFVDDDYVLMTTVNFRDALRRFRLPDRVRLLWVDAVCINQEDMDEKGRQIPFMAQIYSGASRVLVWLGEYPEQAESLRQMGRWAQRIQMLPGSAAAQHDDHAAASTSSSVRGVFELPWFTRLWVIQEVVLNADVLFCCGRVEVPWMRVVQVIREARAQQPQWLTIPLTMSDLWMLRFSHQGVTPRCETIHLIHELSSAKCSADRDKVWALSALATDLQIGRPGDKDLVRDGKIHLRVDYSKGSTKLYLELARTIMQSLLGTASREFLLVYAGMRSDGQPSARGLPSWVPDWRLPAIRKPIITGVRDKYLTLLKNVSLAASDATSHSEPKNPSSDGKRKPPLSGGCEECETTQRNDIQLRFTSKSHLVRAEWVGEPFPKTSEEYSITAWVRRTLQDLAFHMQDTVFQGDLYQLYNARLPPPTITAIHFLLHVLLADPGFPSDIEKDKNLLHWLEKISSKPLELAPDMLSDLPEVHFPNDSLLVNRRLFLLKEPLNDVAAEERPFSLGVGPDHMKTSDDVLLYYLRPTAVQKMNDPSQTLRHFVNQRKGIEINSRKSFIFQELVSTHKSCQRARDRRHVFIGDCLVFSTGIFPRPYRSRSSALLLYVG